MEKRIQGETDMPRKSTPQDEWEAKVATGPAVDDLFGDPKENPDEALEAIEPDDIPEPEVPQPEPPLKIRDQRFTHVEEQLVTVSGHQYTDYPSTLYLERHIGATKLGWTFRGTDDEAVWNRAVQYLRKLDDAAKRYEPKAPEEEAYEPEDTIPACPVHKRPMKESQYGGYYCVAKMTDGTFCKHKVK
jgi:hypothetical protein